MNQTVEHFSANAKENLAVLQDLTTKAQVDAQALMELNLATTKSLMSELITYAKATMTAQDPQSLATLQAGLAKPVGEIATAYAHEFQRIMASASAEFMKTAQGSMIEVQKGMTSMLGSATNNAPSGAGYAADSLNQLMAASKQMFETVQTSSEHAMNTVRKVTKPG